VEAIEDKGGIEEVNAQRKRAGERQVRRGEVLSIRVHGL